MNEQKFTHENEVFDTMWKNFDLMLERTVGSMIMRNADESTVTLKIAISLDRKTAPDEKGGFRTITHPSFKHDLSSVMQVKDKMSGTYKGNVELLFDENGKPIVRDIDDGQVSMFDEDGKVSVEDDDDSNLVSLPLTRIGLPETTIHEADYEDVKLEAEELTPFAWLMDFRNEAMRVTESAGVYTVRSCDENKVILSSAFVADSPFHIDAEKLKPHEGHALICVTSPENAEGNGIESVEIWDDEDGTYIFGLDNPKKDAVEAPAVEEEDYPYEEPEENIETVAAEDDE